MVTVFQNICKEIEENLQSVVNQLNKKLFRQVSDVLRLYRRTNRRTPTQCYFYMTALFTPIYDLLK